MAKIEFRHDMSEIKRNLAEFGDRVDTAIELVVRRRATAGTADMKTNAPWNDITTAARNGLFTEVHVSGISKRKWLRKREIGKSYSIVFSHTVFYGIWLEIANSGKYQIIMPTVRKQGNILMAELEDLFGSIQSGAGRR